MCPNTCTCLPTLPLKALALDHLSQLGQDNVLEDTTYNVNSDGDVYVADPIAPPSPPSRLRRQVLATPDRTDSNNLPIHHSNPTATNKLFLNFQGEVITGTQWNSASYNPQTDGGGYSPITVRPFYASTNVVGPITLSATQANEVTGIWMRVAEDFRPFNIDVTTERPVRIHATVWRCVCVCVVLCKCLV